MNARLCPTYRRERFLDADVVKLMANLDDSKIGRIDFGENQITHVGVKAIVARLPNSQIHGLSMEKCLVGDEGAALFAGYLQSNDAKLTDLYLANNQISVKGSVMLAEAVINNKYLHSLDLQKNIVKNKGAKAFAKVVETNKVLTQIWLDSTGIGHRGIQYFAAALEKNSAVTTLELMGNVMQTNRLHDKWYDKVMLLLERNNAKVGKVMAPKEDTESQGTWSSMSLDDLLAKQKKEKAEAEKEKAENARILAEANKRLNK